MVENPSANRSCEDVGLDGAEHPEPVDAVVAVEPLVLGGQERGLHIGRHLAQRNDRSPLEPEIGDQPAVGGVDLGGLVGIVATQLLDGGTGVPGTGAAPRRRQNGQPEGHRGEESDQNVATRARRQPARLQARQPEALPGRIMGIRRIHRILWVGHVRKLADCEALFQRVPLAPMTELLKTLTARGLLQDATAGLAERLQQGPLTAYVGFDPTADSLHVGSLVPVIGAAWLQRFGHTPIVLIGGGTGMVGDPSGKRSERPILPLDQIDRNAQAIRAQLARFLSFDGSGSNSARLRNNADWLRELPLMDFLREAGRHLTLGFMLQKDSVRSRLESGISYTEFSYMAIQAYDFWHLFRTEGCELQIGGSDQWGNITAGIELIGKREGQQTSRAGLSSDHQRVGHQVREERGRQHLARPGQDQSVPVLSVLDQHRRSRCRALPQAVHLSVAGRDRRNHGGARERPWKAGGAAAPGGRHDGAGARRGRGGAGDGDQPALFGGVVSRDAGQESSAHGRCSRP